MENNNFNTNDTVYFVDEQVRKGVIIEIKKTLHQNKIYTIKVNGWKHPIKLFKKHLYTTKSKANIKLQKIIVCK